MRSLSSAGSRPVHCAAQLASPSRLHEKLGTALGQVHERLRDASHQQVPVYAVLAPAAVAALLLVACCSCCGLRARRRAEDEERMNLRWEEKRGRMAPPPRGWRPARPPTVPMEQATAYF